jgi:hypothetical protein
MIKPKQPIASAWRNCRAEVGTLTKVTTIKSPEMSQLTSQKSPIPLVLSRDNPEQARNLSKARVLEDLEQYE